MFSDEAIQGRRYVEEGLDQPEQSELIQAPHRRKTRNLAKQLCVSSIHFIVCCFANGPQADGREIEGGQVQKYHPRVSPCSHRGRCGIDAPECECYKSQQYCQRNCQCSDDCKHFTFITDQAWLLIHLFLGQYRFTGCKCRPSKIGLACTEHSNCFCRKAGRECDPELCLGCNARDSAWGPQQCCRNADVQQQKHQVYMCQTWSSFTSLNHYTPLP